MEDFWQKSQLEKGYLGTCEICLMYEKVKRLYARKCYLHFSNILRLNYKNVSFFQLSLGQDI